MLLNDQILVHIRFWGADLVHWLWLLGHLLHVHLLAGLALGMGLRYAGTQDSSAASTLLDLAEKLLALKASLPEPGPGRAPRQLVSKQDLESALCTVMQSACCVLAGSGDVRAMRLGDWGHCAACILFSCNLNLHADCAKWK